MNDWYSFLFGGFLGDGISENIREAYAFIAKVRILEDFRSQYVLMYYIEL